MLAWEHMASLNPGCLGQEQPQNRGAAGKPRLHPSPAGVPLTETPWASLPTSVTKGLVMLA